jgi:LmbE family N-acetylglucosaminyl deacetylase
MKRTIPFLTILLALASIPVLAEEIAPAGKKLVKKLDAMDVEHLWLPGGSVDWQTGEPNGKATTGKSKHTHCSAFAAEACRRLGIYLLRPPEHSTVLLANAQYDWLFSTGSSKGWFQVKDSYEAQHDANQGYVVVAVYREQNSKHPGHIAIIRPSTKSAQQIAAEGPQVTQAGGHNARSTSLQHGFANHPDAWGKQKVRYFAHKVGE